MMFLIAVSILAQAPAVPAQRDREQMACAPMSLPAAPVPGMRVIAGNVPGRFLFGPGDGVVINAGTAQGLQKGQQYFVRRYVRDKFTPMAADFVPHSVHTAGWVTIVDTRNDLSVATVTHACDGILQGDYLEPFVDPVYPAAALAGAPDFEHPARLVMGDERRQSGAAGSLMLMNRGSDHDVRAGQTVTIYRETTVNPSAYDAPMKGQKHQGSARVTGPILEVGRGTVLSVRPQTSLIRIDSSREAVYLGDLAAIHRITQ
jgi:hypothetical protein